MSPIFPSPEGQAQVTVNLENRSKKDCKSSIGRLACSIRTASASIRLWLRGKDARAMSVSCAAGPIATSAPPSQACRPRNRAVSNLLIVSTENGKKRFMNMVALLSKTFALAVPLPETSVVRDHLSFYQNVRAAIRKRLDDGTSRKGDANSSAVRQVISGAIKADGIIDLFAVAGLPEANVGILSDEFLDRLAALPQKNLALETLKKLLSDQIKSRERPWRPRCRSGERRRCEMQ
jgi:hypothetical protein